jgi:hypothetical protein
MDITCTTGKDGKKYYFKGGKRIAKPKSGTYECAKAPKKAKRSKTPKKVKSPKKAKTPKKSGVYVWSMKDLLGPNGQEVYLPYRWVDYINQNDVNDEEVQTELFGKYGKDIIYVDETGHKAFTAFAKNRTKWSDAIWTNFINVLYPRLLPHVGFFELSSF